MVTVNLPGIGGSVRELSVTPDAEAQTFSVAHGLTAAPRIISVALDSSADSENGISSVKSDATNVSGHLNALANGTDIVRILIRATALLMLLCGAAIAGPKMNDLRISGSSTVESGTLNVTNTGSLTIGGTAVPLLGSGTGKAMEATPTALQTLLNTGTFGLTGTATVSEYLIGSGSNGIYPLPGKTFVFSNDNFVADLTTYQLPSGDATLVSTIQLATKADDINGSISTLTVTGSATTGGNIPFTLTPDAGSTGSVLARFNNNNSATCWLDVVADGTNSIIRSNDGAGTVTIPKLVSTTGTFSGTVPFTQSGTGATARTVDAKLKDGWLSVKDFGATGDGTTNDRAAIQAAIDAASAAGGGVVYFPHGTYRVQKRTTESLTGKWAVTGTDNVSLIGESKEASIIKPLDACAADTPVIYTGTGVGDFTIASLTIDGNKTARGLAAYQEDEGINMKSPVNVVIRDCIIRDCGQDAIDIDGDSGNRGSNVWIGGCLLKDNNGSGIHTNFLDYGFYIANKFESNAQERVAYYGDSLAGGGIDFTSCYYIDIGDCMFDSNARDIRHLASSRVKVHHSTMINSGTANVWVSYSGEITLDHCFMSTTGAPNVYSTSGDVNVDACTNYCNSNAIVIAGAGTYNITNSILSTAGSASAIYSATNAATSVNVINNIFPVLGLSGVRLDYPSPVTAPWVILGNRFVCGGSAPIYLSNASGVRVERNTITGSTTTNQIRFLNTSNSNYVVGNVIPNQITLSGSANIVRGNVCDVLYFNGSGATANIIEDNRVSTSGTYTTATAAGQYWRGNTGAAFSGLLDGKATLVSGSATVTTAYVTAASNITLTTGSLGTVTAPQPMAVTARTAGTSFVITSATNTDTSDVHWSITESN